MTLNFLNTNSFENQLSVALDAIWSHVDDNHSKQWTKAVKEIMMKACIDFDKQKEYQFAASGIENPHFTEWLFDFVAYDWTDNSLTDVFLIAESEWKGPLTHDYWQDIQDDFEKLLVGRAQHRLMIFEEEEEGTSKESVEFLIEIVKNFKLSSPGDRYMFSVWVKKHNKFHHFLYVHETRI